MKLSTLMIIKAVVCITLGAVLLLAPGMLYSLFGASLNDAGKFAAREYGAALMGTFLLTWYARNATDSRARRAIILDLFIYDAIGCAITIIAIFSGVMNFLGWSVVGLYGLLAVGYGYFWFKNPSP
jgi:hypothetical protein